MIDHARGKGWFADPMGKPRLFLYGRNLMEFVIGAIFLRTRPGTEEAYAAAKSTPTRGSGDGVTVSLETLSNRNRGADSGSVSSKTSEAGWM